MRGTLVAFIQLEIVALLIFKSLAISACVFPFSRAILRRFLEMIFAYVGSVISIHLPSFKYCKSFSLKSLHSVLTVYIK